MLIKRLRLKNIRSYFDEEILFPNGSILLSGEIGAGKSTILHAIELALFGLRKTKLSGKALLRHGATDGLVELEFILNEKTIIVRRVIRLVRDEVRQESGFIEINGMRKELTASEITAHLLEMLGYPSSLLSKGKNPVFTYTVYTPQEEMKHILLDEPDNRVDILRKVFGIDKYKIIRENAIIVAKDLQDRIKQNEFIINHAQSKKEIFAQKKTQIAELTKQVETRKSDYDNAIAQEALFTKKLAEAEEILSKSRVISMKYIVAKERVDALRKSSVDIAAEQKNIQELISEISNALQQQPTPPHQQSREELIRQINTQQLFVHQLVTKQNILQERKEHLVKKNQQLSVQAQNLSQFKSQLAAKQHDYDAMMVLLGDKESVIQTKKQLELDVLSIATKTKEAEVHLQHVQNTKQQISSLSSCPTCLQEVGFTHKKNVLTKQDEMEKDLQEKYLHLLEKKIALERSFTTYKDREEQLLKKERLASISRVDMIHLEQNINSLDNVPQEFEVTSQEMSHTSEELALLEKQNIHLLYSTIEDDKKKLSMLDEYDNSIKKYDAQKNILSEKEKQLVNLQAKKEESDLALHFAEQEESELEKQVGQYANAEAVCAAARNEHNNCIVVVRNSEVAWKTLAHEYETTLMYCKELETELAQITQLEHKVQKMKSLHTWLTGNFSQLMMTIEKHLFVAIHNHFKELFQHWFALLMDDEGIAVQLDDMFTPNIIQNGYEAPFEHLSGGERTSSALAYRLALNRVINDVQSMIKTRDLLILDEPTEGFSADQLDRVRLVLEEMHLLQLILVSHESKVEGFVDNVLRVVKGEQGSKVLR